MESQSELSPAEWKVMNAVWERGRAVTAREIHDALADATDWAYTTTKTVLDRLADKAVLAAVTEKGVRRYTPRLSRGRARQTAARSLLERAFGGAAAPLVHELLRDEKLSPDELDELRRMLHDAEPAR